MFAAENIVQKPAGRGTGRPIETLSVSPYSPTIIYCIRSGLWANHQSAFDACCIFLSLRSLEGLTSPLPALQEAGCWKCCSAPFARHLWAEWICDLFLDSWGVLIIFHVFLRRVSNISPRKFKTRAQQFKTIYRDVVLCAMVWFRLSGLPPVADGAGGAVSWSHGLSDVFWYSAKC